MIARSLPTEEAGAPPRDWRAALRDAYRDPHALLADLGLTGHTPVLAGDALARFPFRVTRAFAARMTPGDPHDPLLRQVLPLAAEDASVPRFTADPLGERARRAGGLVSKYRGRALLVTTGACAINCRYCFRREFPYAESVGSAAEDTALRAIAAATDVHEVILSGGDPLVLDDAALGALLARLGAIAHVRRLRVHSRLPVVLPERVTPELLHVLTSTGRPVALVIHANHPRELDGDVAAALGACRRAGLTLLNQAVLLNGVNDDADTLAALSETLFDMGVLPYYVNVLDPVRGSAHFDVDARRASELQEALRARLPGYLVPRFVREIEGAPAKMPLATPGTPP